MRDMIRQRLARVLLRMPVIGNWYLKAMVRALERTPRSKLPPELQQMQGMLQRLPREQRLKILKAGLKGQLPQPEQLGRELRRQTTRQQQRAGDRAKHRSRAGKKRR